MFDASTKVGKGLKIHSLIDRMGDGWMENTGAFGDLGILVFKTNMAEQRSSPAIWAP